MLYKNSLVIKLFIIFYLSSIGLQAGLEEQIPRVKEYLQKISEPRLVLGVANTLELNYFFKSGEPFISNPCDVLANDEQDLQVLQERTLSLDFNNLDSLNLLAKELPEVFALITVDLSTIKFAHWTNEHLTALGKMLKPAGRIVLPLDGSSSLPIIKGDTKEEIFELAKKDAESREVLIVGQPLLVLLPNIISEEMALELKVNDDEVEAQVQLLKTLPRVFEGKFFSIGKEGQKRVYETLEWYGISSQYAHELTNEILSEDALLEKLVKKKLVAKKKSLVLDKLSAEFYQEKLMPMLIEKMKNIFLDADVEILRNALMPAPYRDQDVPVGYVLTITKNS